MQDTNRKRRQRRVRGKITGTADRPRLCVYRSLKHIEAQLIDDVAGVTLASATSLEMKGKYGGNKEAALAVGELLADKAKKAKITNVVFDRNGFLYHGRVEALADGARKGGLVF